MKICKQKIKTLKCQNLDSFHNLKKIFYPKPFQTEEIHHNKPHPAKSLSDGKYDVFPMGLDVHSQIPGEPKKGDLPWGQWGGKEPGLCTRVHICTLTPAASISICVWSGSAKHSYGHKPLVWAREKREEKKKKRKGRDLRFHLFSFTDLTWRLGK